MAYHLKELGIDAVPVGPDIWGNPFHPELVPKASEIAQQIAADLPEYD